MTFNPNVGDLVEVYWEDHWGMHPSWQPEDEIGDEPVICKSVGYVVKKTKKLLVLAPTYDLNNDNMASAMGRLRNCITKGKVLKGL